MPHAAAYKTLKGEYICPICEFLLPRDSLLRPFTPLFPYESGDYDCSICKSFVHVHPDWHDVPFAKESYWQGVKRRSLELACVCAAMALIAAIIYLAQGA